MPRSSTARARLIDSASQVIHERSYATASIDELCAAAGVTKGSFYYFFPSKRDLALAAIDARWAHAQTAILEPAFAPDVEPLERIVRFFHCAAEHQRGPVLHGCPFGNLAIEVSTQDTIIRDTVRDVFDGYCRYFEAALHEAAASGAVRTSSVPDAARALLAYFQGALLLAKTHNDATLIDELADRALDLVGAQHDPRREESA
jgi:TetR/AcrR family transcriptional repressor of nem operon